MSPNKILKLLRIQRKISKAEVAFKVGCTIEDINEIENEGTPIMGDQFLKLLQIYNTSIHEIINLNY